jgi:hypothetical protein
MTTTKGIASKRLDVYKRSRAETELIRKRKKESSSKCEKGIQTNVWGQFVGRGDIARGLDHFNNNRLAGEEIK